MLFSIPPAHRPPRPDAPPSASRAGSRWTYALLAGLCLGCLPPDFEIAPLENQPIRIDRSKLSRSPDHFQEIVGCEPRIFDITNAVVDDDPDDPILTSWIVDYAPDQSLLPDLNNSYRFTFDPRNTPQATSGKVHTVEVIVYDRPIPLEYETIDEIKEYDGDQITKDSVVWFVRFQDSCRGSNP